MITNDPQGVRISSAKYFVDFLASQRSDYFNHRIGIINFGDVPPEKPEDEMLPLTDLEKTNLERIKRIIKAMNLGDTSFIYALRKAHEGFTKAGDLTGRQKVIVFFTDGEPDDDRKLSKAEYFAEIKGFIQQNLSDCQIYVVAVDVKNVYWEKDKKYWAQITQGKTYRISRMDERELDKVYTSIVLQLLRVPEIRWDNVPPEGLEVEIEPYLEKVTFSILKENPYVELVIYRADGRRVTGKDRDVRYFPGRLSEIYSISDPEPGVWKYKIEKGKGKVEVGKAVIPIEVRLLSPKIPHPLGKPMKVIASFLKRDGSPVEEHPAYRLWLGAKVITPMGMESFELVPVEKGIYTVDKIFNTSQKGEYAVELTMKGGNLTISEVKVPVEVKSIPYVSITRPKKDAKFSLRSNPEIEANLLLDGKPIDPAQLFTDDPNSILWAQVEHNKKIIKSIPLRQDREKKWVFRGKIDGIRRSGRYNILVQLGGHLQSGKPFEFPFPEESSFSKRMTLIDLPIYRWYLVLVFAFIIAFVTDWVKIGIQNSWWGWRIGAPILSGMIAIQGPTGEPMFYYLSQFKHKATIGKGANIPIDDPELRSKCGYIVAKWRMNEEGYREPCVEIHYLPTTESKTYETRILEDGDSITICDKYLLTYQK
jgi:hypothetical protein